MPLYLKFQCNFNVKNTNVVILIAEFNVQEKEIILSWLSYSKYFGDLQLDFEDQQSFLEECLQAG